MLLDEALAIVQELAREIAVTPEQQAAINKIAELQDKLDFTRLTGKWVNVYEPPYDHDAKITWSYYIKYVEQEW
jgi:hypothetical protein